MKDKDEELRRELGPMFRAIIQANAALNGWEKKEPKDPEKPNAAKENFWTGFRLLFGIYCLRYALLPLGILGGAVCIRGTDGYLVTYYRQIHIFGFRIVRWTTKSQWVKDEPKFEVAQTPPLGKEVEKELVDGIQEQINKETDREVLAELEDLAGAAIKRDAAVGQALDHLEVDEAGAHPPLGRRHPHDGQGVHRDGDEREPHRRRWAVRGGDGDPHPAREAHVAE